MLAKQCIDYVISKIEDPETEKIPSLSGEGDRKKIHVGGFSFFSKMTTLSFLSLFLHLV